MRKLNRNLKRMKKNLKKIVGDPHNYEFRLITLLSGLLIFVLLAGGIIFYQLSKIAYNVKLDRSENQSLLLIKDIQTQMMVANSSVNSYGFLKEPSLLDQYEKSKKTLRFKVEKLYRQLEKGPEDQVFRIKLQPLFKEKFNILDSVLVVQNESRVNEALNKVLEQVSTAEQKQRAESIPTPKDKQTLRERIFGEGKQTRKVGNRNLNDLNQEILSIREEETQKEQISNTTLFTLQERSNDINLQILKKLNALEANILDKLEAESVKASQSSRTISYTLILFSLSVSALIGITLFSIFRYIQINREAKLTLQHAKRNSDELAETKARFLANMSHEIRTPLNAISGFADLLSKENLPEKQMEKVHIIRQSSYHLGSLINQILDLTKLQSNKMSVEDIPFHLLDEINWVLQVVEGEAEKRNNRIGLHIEESVPLYLLGDSMKLKQILLNIAGNAVKFTQDGQITIDIQSMRTAKDRIELRLRITDTGIGIPPEKQLTIFDEFEQAEKSTTRQFGGTGLGLSITKKLTEIMGGQLYLQSEMGKGTQITVHLPFAETTEKEVMLNKPLLDAEPLVELFGKNVLVVDDEPFNRKLLVTLLHQHNAFTAEAENGREAVEMATKEKFDLIFMDLRMPVMNGKEATQLIRKEVNDNLDELIIIAITANAQLITEQECAVLGFNACMEKPFTERKILEIIRHPNDQKYTPMNTTQELYNLKNLRQLSQDDEEFFKEMIVSFMETTRQGIGELKAAIADGKEQRTKDLAHKLASPCAHLEAGKMHQLLKAIENEANLEEAAHIVEELDRLAHQMIEQMQIETGIVLKS